MENTFFLFSFDCRHLSKVGIVPQTMPKCKNLHADAVKFVSKCTVFTTFAGFKCMHADQRNDIISKPVDHISQMSAYVPNKNSSEKVQMMRKMHNFHS